MSTVETNDQRTQAEKHNRLLLQAAQVAHPVLYQGRQRFIHTFHGQLSGGSFEVDVYLTGSATPLRPDELEIAPTEQHPNDVPTAPESKP